MRTPSWPSLTRPTGETRIREIYGDDVVVVPYIMPGFDLAKACAAKFAAEAKPATLGMVLMQHGIFSFGATAEESYGRMIALVDRAETYLKRQKAWDLMIPKADHPEKEVRLELARLRHDIAVTAGSPVVLATHSDPKFRAFARSSEAGDVSQRGPATPDHILRTKRLPMLGRDVAAYAKNYRAYFTRNVSRAKEPKTMLDPAPRVILDPELGLAGAGRSAREAGIACDLYSHTIDVILRAEALGGYRALSEQELFEFEYWDLEQAKLRRAGTPPVFGGEIALVTGAASGIGRACVDALLKRGAAVVGLDIDPAVSTCAGARPDFLGLQCDITSEEAVTAALEAGVRAYGGLDMLILNAGVFPGGTPIEALQNRGMAARLRG